MKTKGLPWERAKAFDNSAVLSEFIPFKCDISHLRLELHINEELVQEANYDLMIYKPKEMLQDIFIGDIYCNDELLLESRWVVK